MNTLDRDLIYKLLGLAQLLERTEKRRENEVELGTFEGVS